MSKFLKSESLRLAFYIVVVLAVLASAVLPIHIGQFGAGVARATEETIQPSAKDSFLYKNAPTTNYGADQYIEIYDAGGDYIMRSLPEFSLASLPAGATITAANLSLYYYWYGDNNPSGKTVWAYKLSRTDWVEAEATWNIYKTSNNWTTAGGDYVTSNPSGGSTTFPASYGWMTWNVLAIVQDAYANSTAAEFLIKYANESVALYSLPRWYSKEYTTDTTKRPKLVITYTTATTVTTGAATSPSWASATLNGTISGTPNATYYAFVWDTATRSAPGNVTPANAGYANYWTSDSGNYTGAVSHSATNLTSPKVYYFRAAATDGATWVYGEELTFNIGIFTPTAGSLIGHEVVWDGTYLYYYYQTSGSPIGHIAKINPETMAVVGSEWTSTSDYAQGLTYDGTYLYLSSITSPAKVIKIYPGNMTTASTWTGASGENMGYFPATDGTYVYEPLMVNDSPPTYGIVKKIQISDMTTVGSYTHLVAKSFMVAALYNNFLYVGTFNASSKPKVLKIDPSSMTLVGAWEASSGTSIYVLRIVGNQNYIYAAAGGGGGNSSVFKINTDDMSLIDSWVGTDTGILDGSGAWGLLYQNGSLFSVACSAPTIVTRINPSTMDEITHWDADTGWDGGAAITTDGTYQYVGLDSAPAYLLRINYSGFYASDISNTPSSHDFGVVQPSSTYWARGSEPGWPLTDGNSTGNVTNDSSFAVNILFSMGNMTGGTTWAIGASPDSNVFRMRLYISGAGNSTVYTALSATPVVLISSLAAGNHTHYEFVLDTPTNNPFSDGVLKTGNMTLTGEAS